MLTANMTTTQMVDALYNAFQDYVSRRIAKSEGDLAQLLKAVESALERQGPSELLRRLEQAEARIAKLSVTSSHDTEYDRLGQSARAQGSVDPGDVASVARG